MGVLGIFQIMVIVRQSGKICYNHDRCDQHGPPDRTTIPSYYKQFVPLKTGGSSLANGLPAINGGSCPDGLGVKQTCRDGDGGENWFGKCKCANIRMVGGTTMTQISHL